MLILSVTGEGNRGSTRKSGNERVIEARFSLNKYKQASTYYALAYLTLRWISVS